MPGLRGAVRVFDRGWQVDWGRGLPQPWRYEAYEGGSILGAPLLARAITAEGARRKARKVIRRRQPVIIDLSEPHTWREYNEHGYDCHYPGCQLDRDEHPGETV